jgi:hypothetical protein
MCVVLDADKATVEDDPLFRIATHVIFSSECLAATTGRADLADALAAVARHSASPAPSVSTAQILKTGMRRTAPLSTNRMSSGPLLTARKAVDEAEALRFGAAVASLKCTRIGGAAACRCGRTWRRCWGQRLVPRLSFVRPAGGAAACLHSFGRKRPHTGAFS